jgi:hypothetical protein
VIDGEKYAIDYKAKNQFMIVEPSKYDGKYYKWTTDILSPIQKMPDWLVKIIKKKLKKQLKIKLYRKRLEMTWYNINL